MAANFFEKKTNPKKSSLGNSLFSFYIVICCFCPFDALAADGDTVMRVIDNLCQWLSGPLAISVGVLVIIYSGYEMLDGEIDKKTFITRCAGIGIIVGAGFVAHHYIFNGIGS